MIRKWDVFSVPKHWNPKTLWTLECFLEKVYVILRKQFMTCSPIVFCRSMWQLNVKPQNKYWQKFCPGGDCSHFFYRWLLVGPLGKVDLPFSTLSCNSGRQIFTRTQLMLLWIFHHVQLSSATCLLIMASLAQTHFASLFWASKAEPIRTRTCQNHCVSSRLRQLYKSKFLSTDWSGLSAF